MVIALLVRLVRIGRVLATACRASGRFFLRGVALLARLVFHLLLLRFYVRYKTIQHTLRSLFPESSGGLLRLLAGRRSLQAGIVLLAATLVSQNVFATGPASVSAEQSPLFALVSQGEGQEESVVLSVGSKLDEGNPPQGSAAIAPEALALGIGGPDVSVEEPLPEEGTAVEKPILPETEGSKSPREKVIHYAVEGGDTASSIAVTFGISTATVLWANNLSETSLLKPGQDLLILPVSGVRHVVAKGDTLAKISTKYKADENEILAFNKVVSEEFIEEGQELIIPGGVIEPPPPPQPRRSSALAELFSSRPVPPSVRAAPGERLQWPTSGRRITQYFRWRHSGLDIDGDYSSPIYAANSGVVVEAGRISGYGLAIMIDHGGGKRTLYGHASKLFVKAGQRVAKGQTIAMVGSTGRSTGTHVHFEVIVGGVKRNPLTYF